MKRDKKNKNGEKRGGGLIFNHFGVEIELKGHCGVSIDNLHFGSLALHFRICISILSLL